MNIVSAMNSAYSYMNNVTIGFTEDQITYFKLLTKLWMIQWNKRIMAQIARLQLIIRQRRAILAQNIFWSVLLQIPKADGVVFVEQLMKSSREDIKKETETCSRYQIAVLGNVVVDGEQEKIGFLMAFTKKSLNAIIFIGVQLY